MTYSEKLKDPRWQKKRLEILERDNFQCQYCGDKEATLHVHHFLYRKGSEPWEYDSCDLITTCEYCHKFSHHKSTDRFVNLVQSIFDNNTISTINLSKFKKSELIRFIELGNKAFVRNKRRILELLPE